MMRRLAVATAQLRERRCVRSTVARIAELIAESARAGARRRGPGSIITHCIEPPGVSALWM